MNADDLKRYAAMLGTPTPNVVRAAPKTHNTTTDDAAPCRGCGALQDCTPDCPVNALLGALETIRNQIADLTDEELNATNSIGRKIAERWSR